ncbi:MAG: hypothetical protein CVV33_00885 [Methanomicrobiales archaeon HGW-Methanomicrobiales-4]|nr:MAG: hypothetical protein CVV33_00885 [Methanomicrobiales archaeon HGW-Methanomicrobiales-4]
MKVRFFLLISCLLTCLMFSGVVANPPSDMKLTYDEQAKTLNVTIIHPVGGAVDHYIKSVSITENGKMTLEKTYSSQDGDTVTYTYPLTIPDGSPVSVTATCSKFGSLTKDLSTGSTPAQASSPGFTFIGTGMAVGLGLCLILLGKRN